MTEKNCHAVITGDIINSSRLSNANRKKLLEALKHAFETIDKRQEIKIASPAFEIYRGDSFQGVVTNPGVALEYVILIRLYLKKSYDTRIEEMWDARMAIGLGEIEQSSKNIAESDGTAFRNSGPLLDHMKAEERLVIRTPWPEVNEEFEVQCAFLDTIISRWSASQAEVILEQMEGHTQVAIAQKLKISQSAVNQRLKAAHWEAVEKFINRYRSVVASKISQ